ncbi:class I SAM-dependent methyltransferase [Kallotenue papyrolyticum]|uniref:class I SAM-dependent methyltransferase n=1 Tax=Kallotenue papyrolyticum TaxID=1325125 RepID=UPI000492245B|nr:class I SAM-dependent methyltransferase [Kallotenue papyrolyticum]
MASTQTLSNQYALTHTQQELERLVHQGRFLGELTEYMLHRAGLAPGMRVLDVGCGAGDVSFLASKLVGPEGAVIGVDRAPEAVAYAKQRAQQAGLENVCFIAADATQWVPDAPVDALIGRLVLMYFPDPAAVLRRLLAFVKPGGIVAFQELDTPVAPLAEVMCDPICETYMAAGSRITQTLTRLGADTRTGVKLRRIFEQAGLPGAQTIAMARYESGTDSAIYAWIEQLTRTLLPLMQQTGIATAEAVQVDTLAERMRQEAVEKGCTLVTPSLVAAWARKD